MSYDINSIKIDPSQLNNFSLEKLYNKGNIGVIKNILRNGYNKCSTIIEEDFSNSPNIITEEGDYKNFINFNDIVLSDMSYSLNSNGRIEKSYPNTSRYTTVEIRQIEKSEKLPEFFSLFFRLGFLCDNLKINDENMKKTFDSNTSKFIDIFKSNNYIKNENSYIDFYNEIDKTKILRIKLSDFLNNNQNNNTFFDGIITRKYLLNNNIPEELNNNRLIAKIRFDYSPFSYGFFISLIQMVYAIPHNYPSE